MSACRRCGAAIVWVRTPAGKAMPCDARPVYIVEEEGGPEKGVLRDGRVVSCHFVEDPGEATALGYVPHFATCKPPQEQPQSIYTQGNPYGYRLNLRHPLVQKLYDRYKERLGISRSTPLSDEERLDFLEKVKIEALRPITREQVERVWRGEWEEERFAGEHEGWQHRECGRHSTEKAKWCPKCGKAMTDEAVDMVMERLEALHSETKTD